MMTATQLLPGRRFRPWRAGGIGLLVALLMLASAMPALAHATLVESTPADSAVVPRTPTEVTLRYDQPVTVSAGSVKVLAPDGTRVDTGRITTREGQTVVADSLPATLSPGTYTILWRVVSADTHTVFGASTFSVHTASATTGAAASAAADQAGAGAGAAELLDVSRLFFYVGLILLLGGLGFLLALWPSGRALKSTRRLLWIGWAAGLVGTVGGLLMQGPYSEGLSLYWTFDPELIGQVLPTRYGVTALARVVFLLGLGGLLFVVRRLPRSTLAVTGGLLGLGLLVSTSAVGHAGTGDLVGFAFPADVLHLAAASAWMGGLVVLAAVLLRKPPAELAAIMPRWSRYAELSVLVLVVTGVFSGWRQVREWGALFDTTYGLLLLGKLALVVVALAFGALGRSRVHRYYRRLDSDATPPAPTAETDDTPLAAPSGGGVATLRARTAPPTVVSAALASPRAARILRRGVMAETVIGLVVLGVTSFLVATVPADESYFPTFEQSASVTSTVNMRVQVAPARVGLDDLQVELTDPAGRPLDVRSVTGRWTLIGGDNVVPVTLVRKSLGHYESSRVELSTLGTWQLSLITQTSDIDATSNLFTVRIR